MKPIRIQRKRVKGFKLPPNTVSVTRPGTLTAYEQELNEREQTEGKTNAIIFPDKLQIKEAFDARAYECIRDNTLSLFTNLDWFESGVHFAVNYNCAKAKEKQSQSELIIENPVDKLNHDELKKFKESLLEQTKYNTIDEILSEVSGVPLAFIKDGTYTYFESSWIYESMQLWGDQQTAPLLKRIEELEQEIEYHKRSSNLLAIEFKEKDKLIEELTKENEGLKEDAEKFHKLKTDLENISKKELPDLGFGKITRADLNTPMDI